MLEPAGLAGALVSAEPVAGRVRARKIPEGVSGCAAPADHAADLRRPDRHAQAGADRSRCRRHQPRANDDLDVVPSWEAGWCPSVASTKSAGGDSAPGATVIEAGTVWVDFGIISEGYASDLQRTSYLRAPPKGAPAVTSTPGGGGDGIQMAADLLKPGVVGWDIDSPVRG